MESNFYTLIFYEKNKRKLFFSLFLFFIMNIIFGQTVTFNTSGSWTAPAGVTSIIVEVWGAGGGGQKANGTNSAGGGGSGGGYVRATYTVIPGNSYAYVVGLGGTGNSGGDGGQSYFINVTTIKAVGGKGAGAQAGNNVIGTGAIAPTTGNVGGVLANTYGGNGGAGNRTFFGVINSGGGGSSGGEPVGNNAVGINGGASPTNGYSGADGIYASNVGVNGGIGAGGSGGARNSSGASRNGGVGGNGQVRITYCTGTPTGGTASAAPTSGLPSSVFTASVTGSSSGFAFSYQWEWSPTGLPGTWSNITGATGASATITAVSTQTTTYYRRKITCFSSGLSTYSSVCTYTTVITYCSSTATINNDDYITNVSFLGALSPDFSNPSTYSSSPSGYQDFTGLPNKAIQAQGNGVNIYLQGIIGKETTFKAWIDWNNDGAFNNTDVNIDTNGNLVGSGERVYNPAYLVETITFGIKVPNNVAPGNYRIRIKGNLQGGSSNFDACNNIQNGETEDYIITVIANCPAIITAKNNGVMCGTSSVQLQATATTGVTQFKWYDAETGGNLIGTSAASGNTTTFNTPSVSSTTTYYVSAYNGTCESLVRIPVDARIKLVPNLTFSSSNPTICGEKSIISISATGGNQLDYLIEEDFESGGLGVFTPEYLGSSSYPNTEWKNKSSIYIPSTVDNYKTWFPAISSGVGGNKFAIANSDIAVNYININNALNSPTKDLSEYINLTLSFKMYFSRYFLDNTIYFDPAATPNPRNIEESVNVEISLDGGSTWTLVEKILYDVGIGTRFQKKTYNLTPYLGTAPFTNNFKFRIRYNADDWTDGVAIDDIELYGERPLINVFDWSSDYSIQVYSDAAATIPYTGTPINTIYVKPNATELESYSSWDLSATAMLTNGCSTTGDITIHNDTKVWNIGSNNDWKTTNWKPISAKPDATNCIIVKTPVNLFTEDGIGKNLVIKSGGTLTVKSGNSLTIVDDITNETTASAFVVESDANLKQNNDAAVNSANLTVRRNANLKRLEYNYWGAPVTGQMLKAFSPNTVNNRFMTYNESDDLFYAVASPATTSFTVGKGYAIRADNTYTAGSHVFNGQFVGAINNGVITTPINCTSCTITSNGFNLIGNPYPSNLDFSALQSANSGLIYNTYYVWTNNYHNPAMQGSSYPGSGIINNYSVYTALGGLPAPYGFTGIGTNNPVNTNDPLGTPTCPSCIKPNKFIKVGQGFIVKAKTAGTLTFNNSMRSTDGSSIFFNKNNNSKEAEIDRFWISLQTPLDFVSPILLGYAAGATNDYELDYDAELLSEGSDSFYSLLNNQKLAIQGRYPFVSTDVIPLGANFYTVGTYVIRLDNKDGIFANGQAIYLKDKLLNTVVNLQDGNYTFTTNVTGAVLNRFEILYNHAGTLGTDTNTKKEILVYKQGNYFMIDSPDSINIIRIYDASGILVTERKPNTKNTKIDAARFLNGVYVIDIETTNKKYTKKVIK